MTDLTLLEEAIRTGDDYRRHRDCPVAKRRREKEAERDGQARLAREAAEKHQTSTTWGNWWAAVDKRINGFVQIG